MKCVNFHLTEGQMDQLQAMSDVSGLTVAEHIRRAIDAYLHSKTTKAAMSRPPVRIDGDVVHIPLSQGKWAKVDRADYETIPMLTERLWSASWCPTSKTFYAVRREKGKGMFSIHRLITDASEGMVVNHRNHDGLDNTRSNIEICTRGDNVRYRRKLDEKEGKPLTSRFLGVRWSFTQRKWTAQVGPTHTNRYVGTYESEIAAALAYNEAAVKIYGRFAMLNVIEPGTLDRNCPYDDIKVC